MATPTDPAALLAAVQAASTQAATTALAPAAPAAAPAPAPAPAPAAVPAYSVAGPLSVRPIDPPPENAALPAQPKDGKDVLAAKVAAIVVERLGPFLNSILTVLERNSGMMQTITARLVVGGQAAAKAGAPRASRAAAPASADGLDKVRNNMLFNRYMFINDPAYRERIINLAVTANAASGMTREAILNQFEVDSSCKGKEPGSEGRLSAEAKIVWGFLGKAQKEAIKAEFETWKNERAANGAAAPLTSEGAPAAAHAAPVLEAAASQAMTPDEITALLGDGGAEDSPF